MSEVKIPEKIRVVFGVLMEINSNLEKETIEMMETNGLGQVSELICHVCGVGLNDAIDEDIVDEYEEKGIVLIEVTRDIPIDLLGKQISKAHKALDKDVLVYANIEFSEDYYEKLYFLPKEANRNDRPKDPDYMPTPEDN